MFSKGLRLNDETERPRVRYDTEFIQGRLAGYGAPASLNEDARLIVIDSSTISTRQNMALQFIKPVLRQSGIMRQRRGRQGKPRRIPDCIRC
jgi:hypothetical protein